MGVEGGGVKGPPMQSSGADIVKNMFEQAQAKPMEAQQQAQQLREQSAVQEQSRSAIRERSAEDQPKTGAE
ncbi:MAG TPA: hypothetical protein VFW62_05030, partial [bacterium]|nr:hypothetical protein [bacterium]